MPEFTIETDVGETISFEADTTPSPADMDFIIMSHRRDAAKGHKPKEFSSPLSMTDEEIREQVIRDSERGFDVGDFASGVGQGVMQLIRLGGMSVSELAESASEGDIETIAKTGVESVARAVFDLTDIAEAVGGRIGDVFVSDEEAIDRQVDRRKQDILDQEKRRQGLIFEESEVLPSATEVGSFVLDPTNLIGVGLAGKGAKIAGLGAKTAKVLDAPNLAVRKALEKSARLTARATGKALSGVAKVADKPVKLTASGLEKSGRIVGLPREAVTNIVGKGLGLDAQATRQLQGFTTLGGAFASPLGQAEIALKLGAIGGRAGNQILGDAGRILNILGDSDRQLRFIKTAMLDPNISQKSKRLLSVAGNGTQKGLDLAFNSASNALTTGIIQATLAKMATDDSEAIGSAFGSGLLLGGAIPTGSPAGRPGRLVGAEADKSFIRFQYELAQKQALEKLTPADKALFGNLAASGIDSNIILFDGQSYKDHFIADVEAPAKKTPFWEDENGNIFLNVEAKGATEKLASNIGQRIARDIVDKNPEFKQRIIDEIDPKAQFEPNLIIDQFIDDSLSKLFTGKASDGAIRSSISKNPDTLDLVESTMKTLLSRMGIIDGATGAPTEALTASSGRLMDSKFVKNAFNNYNKIGEVSRDVRQKENVKEAKRTKRNLSVVEKRAEFAESQQKKLENVEEVQRVQEEDLSAKESIVADVIANEQVKFEFHDDGSPKKKGRRNIRNPDKQAKDDTHTAISEALSISAGVGQIGLGKGNEGVVLGAVADAIPDVHRRPETGINPRQNAITLQEAIINPQDVFIRGVLTGSAKGGVIEPFAGTGRVLQIQAPKGKDAGTAINFQFIDKTNAKIGADRIAQEQGTRITGDEIDAEIELIQNAVKQAGGQLSDVVSLPDFDGSIVAQMLRSDLNKDGKGSIEDNKLRILKSIDPRNITVVRLASQ